MRPSNETLNVVHNWLISNGIAATPLTPAGDWLSFAIPVAKANTLFDADFGVFTHEETGKTLIRTLSYAIPSSLIGHIELVHPTITSVVWHHISAM